MRQHRSMAPEHFPQLEQRLTLGHFRSVWRTSHELNLPSQGQGIGRLLDLLSEDCFRRSVHGAAQPAALTSANIVRQVVVKVSQLM